MQKIEKYIEVQFLHKKNQSFFLQGFLYVCSLFYASGVYIRHKLFDWGIFSESIVNKPVISVGSIIAGGAGKTPFTQFLAEKIQESVVVLHRGYRSSKSVDGNEVSSFEEGDEAFILSKKLKNAKVVVGKNRLRYAKKMEKENFSYYLLDSGLQYRYIKKNMQIIVLHKDNLLGERHFLPRGFLKDSLSRLQVADYICINGVSEKRDFDQSLQLIKPYTNAKVLGMHYVVQNKEQLAGKKVGAFCAIGSPQTFFALLEQIGCQIVYKQILPDHTRIADETAFVEKAFMHDAEVCVCTEKDFIKLEHTENIVPLMIEISITQGADVFSNMLQNIKELIHKNK